jgi:hypothetical protein
MQSLLSRYEDRMQKDKEIVSEVGVYLPVRQCWLLTYWRYLVYAVDMTFGSSN